MRPFVAEAVSGTSYRSVEEQSGINRTALFDFVKGGRVPHETNLTRLERWASGIGGWSEDSVTENTVTQGDHDAESWYLRELMRISEVDGITESERTLHRDSIASAYRGVVMGLEAAAAMERAVAMRIAHETR
ncbi:MAG: hypothetical protein LBG44_11325 [Gemmatimonadota bacterium]|nr:hypothetical protein [Gemmatimonadota bacterium]